MQHAIVNASGIILNIIAYDGSSEYKAPAGCTLQQVNDWLTIGQTVSTPAPVYTPPTAQQQAALALIAGINIVSTGTPAINGTYALDADKQAKVNGVITCIMVNDTFPNAAETMNWYDSTGKAHLFPSITVFKNFATAFINFIAAVDEYANSNGDAGPIPSNNITIA